MDKKRITLELAEMMDGYMLMDRKIADILDVIERQRKNTGELENQLDEMIWKRDAMSRIMLILSQKERLLINARMRNRHDRRETAARRLGYSQKEYDALWRSALRNMALALEKEIAIKEETQ